MGFYHRVMCPKDADGMANGVDLNQQSDRASVKPTYGVNYVLKSPTYAEIQDQRRPPYFQYSVLYAQTQTPRRPLQWQNPDHVSISPAYLWSNCVCACARPRVCGSVICSYWTSCIGQPIIRVPQVHEWQVSHVAISGFWPLIAVEVWKIHTSTDCASD